ncbi:netrin-1-like protein [Leptotrombidium deliense]|uniref:Netrin-1-like protein n=1 Tax=Leptotrombidium deliense TaxID=299467 RepID=A0A443SRV5_9ACAR|nr:netrin-1-like protein [Leptotrombidium deliense]
MKVLRVLQVMLFIAFIKKWSSSEASILRMRSSDLLSASLPVDPCYDEFGNPRRCIPSFVNAAFNKDVKVSSECGSFASRYCISSTDEKGETIHNCHICDKSNPKLRHPSAYLTDLNNPNNVTCWVSEPFTSEAENVTLTLSLGKKYELTYISLQFCSKKPDSMAIFKSMDYGDTWHPFQYYSSQCRKVFGRQNRATITKANEQEPLCTDSNSDPTPGGRIAFSTLEGRPSAYDFDNSPVLQDWVTATDIKIAFTRMNALPPRPQLETNTLGGDFGVGGEEGDDLLEYNNDTDTSNLLMADYKPDNSYFYAVSDFSVGGRCKCNGHASRYGAALLRNAISENGARVAIVKNFSEGVAHFCFVNFQDSFIRAIYMKICRLCVHNKKGQLVCDCKHNTAGRDCEKCKQFHFDKPWGRATAHDAHECKQCNCNLHARRCRFNMELFKLSGRKSGGVCLKCRHNTAGSHCHYCKEGYFRDHTKPITHRKVCKPCECHPIGASGRICNQTTGQCPCKDGVTGLTCNRCSKGYQQTRSPIAPCISKHCDH